MVDDRMRRAIRWGWYGAVVAVALYAATRPRIVAFVEERLPSAEQVAAVIRRAEAITKDRKMIREVLGTEGGSS